MKRMITTLCTVLALAGEADAQVWSDIYSGLARQIVKYAEENGCDIDRLGSNITEYTIDETCLPEEAKKGIKLDYLTSLLSTTRARVTHLSYRDFGNDGYSIDDSISWVIKFESELDKKGRQTGIDGSESVIWVAKEDYNTGTVNSVGIPHMTQDIMPTIISKVLHKATVMMRDRPKDYNRRKR